MSRVASPARIWLPLANFVFARSSPPRSLTQPSMAAFRRYRGALTRFKSVRGLSQKKRSSRRTTFSFAPPRGFEPRTQWLTATCSAN